MCCSLQPFSATLVFWNQAPPFLCHHLPPCLQGQAAGKASGGPHAARFHAPGLAVLYVTSADVPLARAQSRPSLSAASEEIGLSDGPGRSWMGCGEYTALTLWSVPLLKSLDAVEHLACCKAPTARGLEGVVGILVIFRKMFHPFMMAIELSVI